MLYIFFFKIELYHGSALIVCLSAFFHEKYNHDIFPN